MCQKVFIINFPEKNAEPSLNPKKQEPQKIIMEIRKKI